jgi:hypothetical protein
MISRSQRKRAARRSEQWNPLDGPWAFFRAEGICACGASCGFSVEMPLGSHAIGGDYEPAMECPECGASVPCVGSIERLR